uniref:Uncharacterized protein n=1 Tax=viral metagenome TaxID=1070528 RepID=A0A6C0CE81_9ZZZZ
MIRGDLLIYTKNGIKRLDHIYDNSKISPEIDEINQKNIKNYYLYKLKTIHNIDYSYLDANNKILCIQNLPYELKMNECKKFIEDNLSICSPKFVSVNNITDFDYIGYPLLNSEDNLNEDFDEVSNDDKYRFQGLILLGQNNFTLNNNINNNTIGFLNKYLHNNNIPYEIYNNNVTTTIKFNLKDVTNVDDINTLSLTNIRKVINGFCELNTTVNTTDKNVFYFLKYIFLQIGVLISAHYVNSYIIKIPNLAEKESNYFIYNNYIWSKVKKNVKTDKYNGQLFKLSLNQNILTEAGIISSAP